LSEPLEADRLPGAPHPRETINLYGHANAEAALLAAWNQKRLPHALLIGGPEGIGKATLAYRVARFVLARHGKSHQAESLAIDEDHPVARQVRALAHPDLLVLRRVWNEDTKKLRTEIRTEDVRRTVSFFGSTSAYGGHRVCIVDTADELNRFGANSILKVLEEPPSRSLLIIVSHSPGRLLPTIRSRCRRLLLRPLSVPDITHAINDIAKAEGSGIAHDQIGVAAEAGGGSVRRTLELLLAESLEVRSMTIELLGRLPAVEGERLHALSDKLRRDEDLIIFAETLTDWLAAAATAPGEPSRRLARLAVTWEKVRRAAAESEEYNLDRKPLVFQVFSDLAEATRR
jgi:DNA polymerase-3 subunit delta'